MEGATCWTTVSSVSRQAGFTGLGVGIGLVEREAWRQAADEVPFAPGPLQPTPSARARYANPPADWPVPGCPDLAARRIFSPDGLDGVLRPGKSVLGIVPSLRHVYVTSANA